MNFIKRFLILWLACVPALAATPATVSQITLRTKAELSAFTVYAWQTNLTAVVHEDGNRLYYFVPGSAEVADGDLILSATGETGQWVIDSTSIAGGGTGGSTAPAAARNLNVPRYAADKSALALLDGATGPPTAITLDDGESWISLATAYATNAGFIIADPSGRQWINAEWARLNTINARWLGADNTGVADTGDGWSQMIETAQAHSSTIHFPAGTYLFSTKAWYTNAANLRITGERGKTTFYVTHGASPSIEASFLIFKGTNVVLDGISFTTPTSPVTDGAYQFFHVSGSQVNVTVKRCEFTGARHAAIRFNPSVGSKNLVVDDCDVYSHGNDPAVTQGGAVLGGGDGAEFGVIHNSRFRNCGGSVADSDKMHAVYISGWTNTQVAGCVFAGETTSAQLKLNGGAVNTVTGCSFKNGYTILNSMLTTAAGNTLEGSAIFLFDDSTFADNILLGNNESTNAYPTYILRSGGNLSRANISRNIFRNSDATKQNFDRYILSPGTTMNNCVVEGNIFWRLPIHLLTTTSSNNLFKDNVAIWPGYAGATNTAGLTVNNGILSFRGGAGDNRAVGNRFYVDDTYTGEAYIFNRETTATERALEFWGNYGATYFEKTGYPPTFTRGFTGTKIDMQRWGRTGRDGKPAVFAANDAPFGWTNWYGGDVILESGATSGTQSSGIQFMTSAAGTTGTNQNTASLAGQWRGNGNLAIYRGGLELTNVVAPTPTANNVMLYGTGSGLYVTNTTGLTGQLVPFGGIAATEPTIKVAGMLWVSNAVQTFIYNGSAWLPLSNTDGTP